MIPCQVRHFIKYDRENKLIPKPLKQVTVFSFKKISCYYNLLIVFSLYLQHFNYVHVFY